MRRRVPRQLYSFTSAQLRVLVNALGDPAATGKIAAGMRRAFAEDFERRAAARGASPSSPSSDRRS